MDGKQSIPIGTEISVKLEVDSNVRAEKGIVLGYLGDGWYVVRCDGHDEEWHESIIEEVINK